MKIGDKVVLSRPVSYGDNQWLTEGSEWVVSNLIQIGKEKYALISNDGAEVFTVKQSSVVKSK